MKILHQPRATVGQIIKDLEFIVAKSPDIFWESSNVEGIKMRKDIAILESTGKLTRRCGVKLNNNAKKAPQASDSTTLQQ